MSEGESKAEYDEKLDRQGSSTNQPHRMDSALVTPQYAA